MMMFNTYQFRISSLLHQIDRTNEAIQRWVGYLRAQDFSSKAPLNLAETQGNISEFICLFSYAYKEKEIDIIINNANSDLESDNEMVNNAIDKLVVCLKVMNGIAAELRYPHSAHNDRMPWSLVNIISDLVSSILDKQIEVLLRPKWSYNFSVKINDTKYYYENKLNSIIDIDTNLNNYNKEIKEKYNTIFSVIKDKRFFIITFPFSERLNPMNLGLLGHEIGHLVIAEQKFIDYTIIDENYRKSTTFEKPYEDEIRRKLLRSNLQDPQNIKEAQKAWRRSFEELVADYIGTRIWGIGFALAVLSLTHSTGINKPCSRKTNKFYPPWRMRLCIITRALRDANININDIEVAIKNAKNKIEKIPYFEKINCSYRDDSIDEHKLISVIENLLNTYQMENNSVFSLNPVFDEDEEHIKIGYEVLRESLDSAFTILNSNININKHYLNLTSTTKELPAVLVALSQLIPPVSNDILYENVSYDFHLATYYLALWVFNVCWDPKPEITKKITNFNQEEILESMNRIILWSLQSNYIAQKFKNYKGTDNVNTL